MHFENVTLYHMTKNHKVIFNVSYGLRLRFEGKSTFTSLPHEYRLTCRHN